MRLLLLLLCFLLQIHGHRSVDPCVDSRVCDCYQDSTNCTCAEVVDSSGRSTRVDQISIHPYSFHHTLSSLSFADCAKLSFTLLSMSMLPPQQLLIRQVERLDFESGIFMDIEHAALRRVSVSHTRIPLLPVKLFYGVSGVDSVRFFNVSIGNIMAHAFTNMHGVHRLAFHSCRIDHVASHAFANLSHVGRFELHDVVIGQLDSDAIVLQNVDSFSVKNSHVRRWSSRGVTLINVNRTEVSDCRLEQVQENAVSLLRATEVDFGRNRVLDLSANALRGMMDGDRIRFVGNVMERAEADAIDTLLIGSDVSRRRLLVADNRFPCQPSLYDLMAEEEEEAENDVFRSNRCVESDRTLIEYFLAVNQSILSTTIESDTTQQLIDFSNTEENVLEVVNSAAKCFFSSTFMLLPLLLLLSHVILGA